MKYILILGGTGAMGIHIVDILSQNKDVKCYVTSRHGHNNFNNITFLCGNALDDTFIKVILKLHKWDAIIDFMKYKTNIFKQKMDLYLSSTNQYFFLSSSRVYAESSKPLNEKSPRILDICKDNQYLKTDEYALAKARQENLLFDCSKKNWTIIRPYVTFSENRLQLSALEKEAWLYRALHKRTIVISKDLLNKTTTLTYGYNVAQGIVSLIGKEDAMGEVFHITSNENHIYADILNVYLKCIYEITGYLPSVYIADHWMPYMGGNCAQIKWDRLYDRIFDNSKISKFLNVNEFLPVKQSISECINSFIKHPSFKTIDWVKEAHKDQLTGDWTPMHEIKGFKMRITYLLTRIGVINKTPLK